MTHACLQEHDGLIEDMLLSSSLALPLTTDGLTVKYEDSGSLDDIDGTSSGGSEGTGSVARETRGHLHTSEHDSGAGSYASSDGNSTEHVSGGEARLMAECGEGVCDGGVYCADSGLGVPAISDEGGGGSGGEDMDVRPAPLMGHGSVSGRQTVPRLPQQQLDSTSCIHSQDDHGQVWTDSVPDGLAQHATSHSPTASAPDGAIPGNPGQARRPGRRRHPASPSSLLAVHGTGNTTSPLESHGEAAVRTAAQGTSYFAGPGDITAPAVGLPVTRNTTSEGVSSPVTRDTTLTGSLLPQDSAVASVEGRHGNQCW